MAARRTKRLILAAATAAAGLVLAVLAGAPLAAAFLAGAGGAAAAALLAWRDRSLVETAAPAPETAPAAAEAIDALPEPVLLIRERKVLVANPAARTLLGDHIEGVDVRLAIRHPAAAEHLTGTSDQPARIELEGLGGEERRWEMETALLSGGTRLVRLIDRGQAIAAERMRTDFVANASHELRTPLATLLGFLETLQDEAAAEDKALRGRFLGIMFDEAKRMHRLVDDLISLSRIEGERFSVPREPVALMRLVQEVQASCGAIAKEKGSDICVENLLESEPVVPGDRAQLHQLLQNLVVNAIKYGRPGTPVTIRFNENGLGMLRLSVIDQGEGIEPEHLPRLTERFYRVEPSRSRAMGGTGLGLAIVKHIVGRHRGRLEIRSRRGTGTVVEVYLPRSPEPLSSKSH
jgi:two-component system phosphate regulon sensor histidine kinase PhoR